MAPCKFGRSWMTLAAASIAALIFLSAFSQWGGSARADEESDGGSVREYRTDLDWGGRDMGPTRETQVVGGAAVPNGRYPFMAHVLIQDSLGRTGRCAGTLIDRDSVLTAAHCLRDAAGVRVFVGRTVLSDGGQGQVRDAVRGIVHPRYTGRNFLFDAGILELEAPVRGIRPVRLATARQNILERPGRHARTAGWGTMREGGTPSNRMRSVALPLRGEAFARRAYAGAGNPSLRYFPPFMVAAGVAGKDACQGDSGGPLFVQQGRFFTQIGVTSYGLGCARRGFPGVWTEVNSPKVRAFIVNASQRNS